MTPADSEILSSLKNDDVAVYEKLFHEHYARLCRYAATILKDSDEGAECVQQVFIKLWEKRNTISIDVSLKAFLFRSVHNTALNIIKHEKIKQQYSEDYRYHATSSYTFMKTEKTELQKQITEAIESLPEQCRLVFRLSRFEELKYSEIAQQLNISVKTVENHMGKALKLMRLKLKDYLPLITVLIPWLIN